MNYFSSRNKDLNLPFKDIFFKGLSEDGGLFLPHFIPQLSDSIIKNFANYNFQEMSYEIFKLFIGDTIHSDDLKKIIDNAYSQFRNSNIVDVK